MSYIEVTFTPAVGTGTGWTTAGYVDVPEWVRSADLVELAIIRSDARATCTITWYVDDADPGTPSGAPNALDNRASVSGATSTSSAGIGYKYSAASDRLHPCVFDGATGTRRLYFYCRVTAASAVERTFVATAKLVVRS